MTAYAAPQAYAESSILTASPGQLVVMLYDGAVRFLTQAGLAMRANELERARERMRRGEAIIDELNVVLDMSRGDVAQHLRSIYLFSKRELRDAAIHRDPERIDGVVRLLRDLRESWNDIAQRSDAPAA